MPLVLNGTGTITGLQAGGLPDATVLTADIADSAVTPAKMAGGTSGGPAFRATNSGTQNPSGSTWTKAIMNVKSFDTNNCYDSATSYRFTPTTAGYYLITCKAIFTGSPPECYVSIYKSGSQVGATNFNGSGTGQTTLTCVELLSANGSTDYFEQYIWTSASGPAASGMVFTASFVRPL